MYLVRVIIVGDTGVGKTSLLVRFHENNFSLAQKTTIGVDYKAKEISIEGEIVKLQIWDTAGQERFRSMTAAFYNRAQVKTCVEKLYKRTEIKYFIYIISSLINF